MAWQERDGPEVAAPVHRGFGSKVTTRMVQSSTRGEVTVDYAPSGLAWRLACPAATVLDGTGGRDGPEETAAG